SDIYPAGELPLAGVTIDALAQRLREREPGRPVLVVKDFEQLPAALHEHTAAGDVVLTLGAGNVTQVGPRLLARLREG
ncbi:MAG: UDP-N-acetylmuramate--L-alanine ligase, partial [Nannocystaceae bacterium]